MIQALLTALTISLMLTLVLEAGFFLLTGKRDKKDLLLVLLVNVLTNPVVVLSYWLVLLLTEWNAIIAFIPLELFAVLVEGYYYKKYGRDFKHPYLFSLTANMLSFWMGVLIQYLVLGEMFLW